MCQGHGSSQSRRVNSDNVGEGRRDFRIGVILLPLVWQKSEQNDSLGHDG